MSEMSRDADGTLWCERCDNVCPRPGEGKLVECGGGYRDMGKHGWGVVTFALCAPCVRKFVDELLAGLPVAKDAPAR